MKLLFFILLLAFSATSFAESQVAIEKANQKQLSASIGHFARSRRLLIEAIREFDSGVKISDPSSLLDPNQWKNTLIDRAEDLDRILSPQPRLSRDGVQYPSDSRLLEESKN